jgi:hypothetical protein
LTSWATFLHGQINVLILTKIGLGYTLGDFFTNSSGHPAGQQGGGQERIVGKMV